MGTGRHSQLLLQHGFITFGVDIKYEAVRSARRATDVHASGLEATSGFAGSAAALRAWCADLTMAPLPTAYFDLIVVCRYLQRDLFPALADALAPGGVLLYETFTEAQRRYNRGPTSPDHLLRAGELRELARTLETIAYEEVDAPEAVARLAARRATNRS